MTGRHVLGILFMIIGAAIAIPAVNAMNEPPLWTLIVYIIGIDLASAGLRFIFK